MSTVINTVKMKADYKSVLRGNQKLQSSFKKLNTQVKSMSGSMFFGSKDMSITTKGLASAATAAFALYVTFKKIKDEVSIIAEKMDRIGKNAKRAGVSTTEYQKAIGAGAIYGIDEENTTTALFRITKSIGDARTGLKATQDAFKQLNISVDDLDGTTSLEVLQKLMHAYAVAGDKAAALASISTLIGQRTTKSLMPAIKDVNGYTIAIEQTTAMQKKSIKSAEKFNDNLSRGSQIVTAKFGDFWGSIAEGVNKTVNKGLDIMGVSSLSNLKIVLDNLDAAEAKKNRELTIQKAITSELRKSVNATKEQGALVVKKYKDEVVARKKLAVEAKKARDKELQAAKAKWEDYKTSQLPLTDRLKKAKDKAYNEKDIAKKVDAVIAFKELEKEQKRTLAEKLKQKQEEGRKSVVSFLGGLNTNPGVSSMRKIGGERDTGLGNKLNIVSEIRKSNQFLRAIEVNTKRRIKLALT